MADARRPNATVKSLAMSCLALALAGCGGEAFPEAAYELGPAGTKPLHLVAADFDGDGADDLALTCELPIAGHDDSAVSILRNDGTGAFAQPQIHEVGSDPQMVEQPGMIHAADLDGDDHLDLIMANETNGSVSVLAGQGDGTFQAPVEHQVGEQVPQAFTLGDVNGDEALDLLLVGMQYAYAVHQIGDGTFEPARPAQNRLPAGLRAGRTDEAAVVRIAGDALDGLAVVVGDAGKVYLFHAGRPTEALVVGKQAREIRGILAAGDFNGDGAPDLIVTTNTDPYTQVLRLLLSEGRSDADSGDRPVILGEPIGDLENPRQVLAADLNSDGHRDLVISPRADPDVDAYALTILLGDGQGGFTSQPTTIPLTGFPDGVVTGDFDADGATDLAIRDLQNSRIIVRLNRKWAGDG